MLVLLRLSYEKAGADTRNREYLVLSHSNDISTAESDGIRHGVPSNLNHSLP
jgi:hypothetical protein